MFDRAALEEQITREWTRERESNRKAVQCGDLPISYEAITSEWLTEVVCNGHPDARVVTHRLDTPDDGMSNRRRIFLSYDPAGTAAGLPPSIFCKATHQLPTRLLLASCGLAQGESIFYGKYRALLDIEAPKCFLAAYDPRSFNSITILDDLTRLGARFCGHTTDVTRAMAEGQMMVLARLHAQFYDDVEVTKSGLPTFANIFANIDHWLELESCCDKGFVAAESVIPARLFQRRAEIWRATLQSVDMHRNLPRTFTHNDVHLKNWYVSAAGAMVLSDWQCFGTGHWARDVAYAISTALSVQNRRRWKQHLLRFYLDAFQAAGGPTIKFDNAWKWYRQHLPSSLTWWTSTMAVGSTQPAAETLEFVARIATAMDDLEALSSFEGA